jgi:hypothetical protein
MHTILLYQNGRRADGIILSASRNIMRVVVKRIPDTVELRRVGSAWTSEDGSRIEFELLAVAGKTGSHGDGNFETKALTFAAGAQAFLPL